MRTCACALSMGTETLGTVSLLQKVRTRAKIKTLLILRRQDIVKNILFAQLLLFTVTGFSPRTSLKPLLVLYVNVFHLYLKNRKNSIILTKIKVEI